MALMGFEGRPIVGIGGDNYFSDYKELRKAVSMENPENPILAFSEDLIPERAA